MDQDTADKLIAEAVQARENAYAPYSKFKVGAAVVTGKGKLYSGCNIENASYSLCTCAERTAIVKAVSSGEKNLRWMAVVADTAQPVAPCGACRQLMAEFGIEKIVMASTAGQRKIVSVTELLPYSFNPSMLLGEELHSE
ncbi:hypothetical protein P22_0225 [Propionispora sp. 2/2-37]|uniref:cytidine deaminase n=1 Tax=Propionispora sp. 2/2-37 TaxID=1677858 RepID=UPI0006BB942B|nr:cytidine deaminase [Propionispora sp. 2/2-37]CUH94163.1 hypothetical protein P22_0225 [Propionispora sp. 2/2-37]